MPFIDGQTDGRESARSGLRLPHKHAIEDGKGERRTTVALESRKETERAICPTVAWLLTRPDGGFFFF